MWCSILLVAAILLTLGVDAAPQPTAATQCAPMDVVFLLDTSKSVWKEDFKKQLKFVNDIVDRLDVGPGPNQTRVGVILIGYTYLRQFYLKTHKTKLEVKTAISHIQHRYSYETNTGNSIRFMTHFMFRSFFGGRSDATRVAMVITDGVSQDPKTTRFEALLARKKGIKMFAIGVGLEKDSELLSIGYQPTDNYVFKVDSFDDLTSVLPNVPKSSCEVNGMTTGRRAPIKRFTLPPLNLKAFKFVPPKTRAPMTPAPSTVTFAPTTRTSSLATSTTSNDPSTTKAETTTTHPHPTTTSSHGQDSIDSTTNPPSTPSPTTRDSDFNEPITSPPSTQAPTTLGSQTSDSTTNPPSTPAPTTRDSDLTESTTNAQPTQAPTTSGSQSSDPTTNPPSTPAPTTSGSQSSDPTTNPPSTPAPTTRDSDLTESTTNAQPTPAPTTSGLQSSDPTTNPPSTPAPTTPGSLSSDSTSIPPSTPAPTTSGSLSSDPTTNPPSTAAPTARSASSPNPTTFTSTNVPSTSSDTPLVVEAQRALENLIEMTHSNEPVEINNAPTKTVSETKVIDYWPLKKSTKKYLKKKRKGNDVSNVITNNKYRWRTAPRNKMGELQYDDTMENDKRIWSMMMGSSSSARFLSNTLSRDVAIADEPKKYCQGKNADVFFALDSSNSIWPEDFKKQLQFVTDLVDTFDFRNNKTRVGIIVYSNDVHMKVALESGWTKEQIKRQISNVEYVSGLTNTSDALRFIRTYGFTEANEREETIKIAIVLTDGISRDPLATKRESVLSREEGIKLFAIGIGKDIQMTELKRIANDPDDKYVFNVTSFDALASIRSLVAVSACGVVTDDQPSNLLYCGADSLADVIFVYDAPGLGARKARLLTSFVDDIKRGLQTSSNGLRIGRRSDNCPSNSNIDLTTDTNLRAFESIQFPGIETLLGQLRMVFPNRLDAKNLAVVFVDESTQNIELATRVLKGDINFHVMVVAIGDPSLARLASDLASYPYNDYLVNIPSYMSLGAYRYEFLQKLCYLITNKPMYLRDARVRDTRNL